MGGDGRGGGQQGETAQPMYAHMNVHTLKKKTTMHYCVCNTYKYNVFNNKATKKTEKENRAI
jgi:hypothetical protein